MTKPSYSPSKQSQSQWEHQGQGQSQSEAQAQAQLQASLNANGNLNGNGNYNESENANGNGNLNGNGNGNLNGNFNINDNTSTTTVHVDVGVTADMGPPSMDNYDHDVIDMDAFCATDAIIIPQVVNQDICEGNAFNVNQANNLNDSDSITHASVSSGAIGASAWGSGYESCNPCDDSALPSEATGFSMSAEATGGSATVGDICGIDADAARFDGLGAASADASVNQEAFTQTISQGANTQFNSMDLNVAGGDVDGSY
jgi:hypothetical protein